MGGCGGSDCRGPYGPSGVGGCTGECALFYGVLRQDRVKGVEMYQIGWLAWVLERVWARYRVDGEDMVVV